MNFLIVNAMAPVTAWVRTDLEGKKKKFASWYEFLRWYDEGFHGWMNMPPNSKEEFTDVLVDTLEDSPRKRRASGADGLTDGGTAARAAALRSSGKGTRIRVDGREFLGFERVFAHVGWEFPSKRCRAFRGDLKAKKWVEQDGHKFELVE